MNKTETSTTTTPAVNSAASNPAPVVSVADMPMNVRQDRATSFLEQSGEFMVHRKLKPGFRKNEGSTDDIVSAVYVDVETTGLDKKTNENIEVAIVPFKYNRKTYEITEWLEEEAFSCLEEPTTPISPEITKITGITNDMVKGQKFDDERINRVVKSAMLVISHKADFDRPSLEKRLPIFAEKNWACSLTDISWGEEGISSGKLEFIAYKFKFYYDAHRALNDCFAGVEILTKKLPVSGEPALKVLLNNARRVDLKVELKAKFELNDKIKSLGGKWDAENKVWYRYVRFEDVDALKVEAENLKVMVEVDNTEITALTRFRK
jgi:DNA polymerase-3 subunit epsilon